MKSCDFRSIHNWLSFATLCIAGSTLITFSATATDIVGSNVVGSLTAGHNNSVTGTDSIAAGNSSTASGNFSLAVGSGAQATGNFSIAVGVSIAFGEYASAFGGSEADGNYSTAMGDSLASGTYSSALGSSEASGTYASALGSSNASGNYSTAMGLSNAAGYAQTTIGQFNLIEGNPSNPSSTDPLFIIGNGLSATARSSAFVVRRNGITEITGSLLINGIPVLLSNQGSSFMPIAPLKISVGTNVVASGANSSAFGIGTIAQSYGSTAVGTYNVAQGDPNSWNSADDLFVVGKGTSTSDRANAFTVKKSGAFGIGTTAPERAVHVVGNGILSERVNGSPQLALRISGTSLQEWQFHVLANNFEMRHTTGTVTTPFVIKNDAPSDSFSLTNVGLGVGVGSPAARFSLVGLATTADIMSVSSSANARFLTINSAGTMGLGTASPVAIAGTSSMHVAGGVLAQSNVGGSMFRGRQLGTAYQSASAIFDAVTDNPSGSQNYFIRGTAGANVNFVVGADGQAYFANAVRIGVPSPSATPSAKLSVNGNARITGGLIVPGIPDPTAANAATATIVPATSTQLLLVPQQGDLSMGEFTAGAKPQ